MWRKYGSLNNEVLRKARERNNEVLRKARERNNEVLRKLENGTTRFSVNRRTEQRGSLDLFQRTRKINQIIDVIHGFIVFYLRGKGNIFVLTNLAKYCHNGIIAHFTLQIKLFG
jgi:lipid II:glycine glycyltransferase (peptidoglycan interpeptide bridge formation enzyme)